MVEGKNLPGVPELDEGIGLIGLDAADNKWSCIVDGIAHDLQGNGALLAASFAGGSTEIRAWRAALQTDVKLCLTWSQREVSSSLTLRKDPDGYHIHVAPLGMGAWHMVVVARRPDFLPSLAEEAVWCNLSKRTTTPIDRAWMPTLVEKLMKEGLLRPASAVGRMSPGLLNINDAALDALVSAGLRNRVYKIVA